MHAGAGGMTPNPDFLAVVGALYPKDAKLIVGCKAGQRSLRAAEAMSSAGYAAVVDQRAGFDGPRDPFGAVIEPGWSAAGLPVELTVEGEPVELAPGVDLSAYRIVQEALTNALKHAGPASVHVRLRYADDGLEVDVVDDGAGSSTGDGGGYGLTGIQERVSVYGGEMAAGPGEDGGFAVHARLPYGSGP